MFRGGLFRKAYLIHLWLKLSKRLACFLSFPFFLYSMFGEEDLPCFLKYEAIHDTGRVAVLF